MSAAACVAMFLVLPALFLIACAVLVLYWLGARRQTNWPPIGSRVPVPPWPEETITPTRRHDPPLPMRPPAPPPSAARTLGGPLPTSARWGGREGVEAFAQSKPEGPPNRLVRMGLNGSDIGP